MVANLAAICSWPNEKNMLTKQQHSRVTYQMTVPESNDVYRRHALYITAEFNLTR